MFRFFLITFLIISITSNLIGQSKLVSTESSRIIIQPYFSPLMPLNTSIENSEKDADFEMHSSFKIGVHFKSFSPVSVLGIYGDVGYMEQIYDVPTLDNINLYKKSLDTEIGLSLINPSYIKSTHLSLKVGLSLNFPINSFYTASNEKYIVRANKLFNYVNSYGVVRLGFIKDLRKVKYRFKKLSHLTFDINGYIPLTEQLNFDRNTENPYIREWGTKELFTSYLSFLFGLGFDLSRKLNSSFELDAFEDKRRKHFLLPYFNGSTKNLRWISGFNLGILNRNYVAKLGNKQMTLHNESFKQEDILNPTYSFSCAYVFAKYTHSVFYSFGLEHILEHHRFSNFNNSVYQEYIGALPLKFGVIIRNRVETYIGCDLAYLYLTDSRNIDVDRTSQNDFRLNYNMGIKIVPSKLYTEVGVTHFPFVEQLSPYFKLGIGI